MSYVNTTTLEIVEAVDIMMAYPDVSFPNRGWTDEDLAPYGYADLNYPPNPPQPGTYENVVEVQPVEVDGVWYRHFILVPMTPEEVVQKNQQLWVEFTSDTQNRLDTFAQTRGYDNMLSLCTYATSPTQKYATEGAYGVQSRDETWLAFYQLMDEVKAGVAPMPTNFGEVVAVLPVLEWPNP